MCPTLGLVDRPSIEPTGCGKLRGMRNRFSRQIAELEVELATLQHELQHAPADKVGQVKARIAAAQRSLRWYRTRETSRPNLVVRASERVHLSEA